MSELAAKLLDLSAEYAEQKTRDAAWSEQYGDHGRTPEEIATEYGDTLREFLQS